MESLRYNYATSSEFVGGERVIRITASDGTSEATLEITVDVQILNNNPPLLTFNGQSLATFVDGSSMPLEIGQIFQPNISDADNNDIFPMVQATIWLQNAPDGDLEALQVDNVQVEQIQSLGIEIERKQTCKNHKVHLQMFACTCMC